MPSLPYRKKLIEVALPLAAINAESAREKSIRHGHPSTLHLWWARRPLAACRAVLFSSLVDDPDSDPEYFKRDGSVDEDLAGIKRADLFNLIEELVMWENSNNPDVIRTARAEIARCVASRLIETGVLQKNGNFEFTVKEPSWKVNTPSAPDRHSTIELRKFLSAHCRPIPAGFDAKVGRVRFTFDVSRLPPAEAVNAFLAQHAPPVLDPFAGGGSIPLEAQRLGLRAYASDLNPVPVLINKALIEIPPKFAGRPPVNSDPRAGGPAGKGKGKKSKTLIEKEWHGAEGLAEDVRFYGQWMCDEAEKRIGHLYPKVEVTAEMARDRADLLPYVDQQLTVIAWLWARTVASPNPAANGAHVPLVKSFSLSGKSGKVAWVEPIIDRERNLYTFAVRTGVGKIPAGTVGRNRGDRCMLTGEPITREYIRKEGRSSRLGTRLLAVVAEGHRERIYLSPLPEYELFADRISLPANIPDTEIVGDTRYLTPTTYGMTQHRHLFTNRQLVTLTTFSDLVNVARELVKRDYPTDSGTADEADAYADAVATYLGEGIGKLATFHNTLAYWRAKEGKSAAGFGRQALAMTWDFVEVNPFAGAGGDAAEILAKAAPGVIRNLPAIQSGVVAQRDACEAECEAGQPLISTDPPYYDNVPYADLSDFFYVWLRRALSTIHRDLFMTLLTPKAAELVADPYRQGGADGAKQFFERGLERVFGRLGHLENPEFPLTIYYAFKQSETDEGEDNEPAETVSTTASTGWETMLIALVKSNFLILGTWPLRTENKTRMRATGSGGSNALASSIVLVCRPRSDNASLATRKEFITAMRRELPEALRNLQRGNIAPVDLAQAAIGPGMAVFSRYGKVLESDGSAMTVRTALGLINQSLDEVLAEQEGEFDSDTRWALTWFDQFGMEEGAFGEAETLSKAKNTAVSGLVEAGIITSRANKVQLVKRSELALDWNPATDKRLTVWEVTQHLIHRLDQQGETGAATLVGQLGSVAEVSRDLAYRLYSTCERKKWAQEALAYNSLVVAWPELTKLALANRNRPEVQKELFGEQ